MTASLARLQPATSYAFRVVLETQGGTFVGSTLRFTTKRVPRVRVIRAAVAIRSRTAAFTFRRAGPIAAARYQCALARVRRGRVRVVRFRSCRSPVAYAGLAHGTYEFLVRAGNRAGFGPAAERRVTL